VGVGEACAQEQLWTGPGLYFRIRRMSRDTRLAITIIVIALIILFFLLVIANYLRLH